MNFFNNNKKKEIEIEETPIEVEVDQKSSNFEIDENRAVRSNPFNDTVLPTYDPNSDISRNLQQAFAPKQEEARVVELSVEPTHIVKTKPHMIEKLSGVQYNPTNIMDVSHITQTYNNGKVTVFDDFTLEIKDIIDRGQFVTILGQSGCGKCFTKDSFITIRNKKTGKIENIESHELIKRLLQPD